MAVVGALGLQYVRHLSLSFSLRVVQSQSAELPATTEARTQGRTADCTSNFPPPRTVAGWFLVCLLIRLAPGRAESQVPRTQVVGSAP